MKLKPFYIRNLRVDPPLILAPMSGLTHTALRQLIAEIGGCGLFYTEMLSARTLPLEAPDSSPWLRSTAQESPIAYQLLVSHPEELAAAIEKIESCDSDSVDLNMGCTSALIAKRGGGIALMKEPKRAEAIVRASRKATDLPLTAKIRLGWTMNWSELRDFCFMLQDNGADAICVHPRLKHDRLKRPARWEYIGRIKEHMDIPVIGNRQIANALSPELYHNNCPGPVEAFDRFVSLLENSMEPEYVLPLLKRFTFYFSQNYAFGHTLWRQVHNANTLATANARAKNFFQRENQLESSSRKASPDICSIA
jgi:tRNA-dihydrouridine synthase B